MKSCILTILALSVKTVAISPGSYFGTIQNPFVFDVFWGVPPPGGFYPPKWGFGGHFDPKTGFGGHFDPKTQSEVKIDWKTHKVTPWHIKLHFIRIESEMCVFSIEMCVFGWKNEKWHIKLHLMCIFMCNCIKTHSMIEKRTDAREKASKRQKKSKR